MKITSALIAAFQAKCLEHTLAYPRCPEGCTGRRLQHHEWCTRTVIIPVGEELYRVKIRVLRWKCSCGRSFRNLPEGILPHSRYVLAAMVPCLLGLLEGESYVNASVETEAAVSVTEEVEGCSPAPSTVHRWVDTLARFSSHIQDRLSEAISKLARAPLVPLPRCRSKSRKGVWGLCVRVLWALGKIPPDFATPCPM